jgi:uncharacterized membrane protein
MAFYVIVPVWLFCVLVGLGMLAFPSSRYRSTHIIVSSTLALVSSALFGILAALLFATISPLIQKHTGPYTVTSHSDIGGAFLALTFVAIVTGLVVGARAGNRVASKLNTRLGWSKPSS